MGLIDTDAAYAVLTDYYHHSTDTQRAALREALGRVESVDAEPVRHGRWIETKHGFCCNQCHTTRPLDWDGQMWLSSFCPNCGARMDGKDGDDG